MATTFAVGKEPCSGLAAGFGSVWVPNCGDSTITRLDLKDGKTQATFPLTIADDEGGVTVGAGSFWILTDTKGTLARIDPATNKVVAEINVAPGSFAVRVRRQRGLGHQLGEEHADARQRADARDRGDDPGRPEAALPHRRRRRRVDAEPGGRIDLARGPQDEQGGRDDRSGRPRRRRRDLGGRRVGVGHDVRYPITRIDPSTNKVAQQFFGEGGDSIRVGLGWIWVTNIRAGNVWRLDPKRILATLAE